MSGTKIKDSPTLAGKKGGSKTTSSPNIPEDKGSTQAMPATAEDKGSAKVLKGGGRARSSPALATGKAGALGNATPADIFMFATVMKNMKSKPDVDWGQVAIDNSFKNAETAKVRFGQIKKKLGFDLAVPGNFLPHKRSGNVIGSDASSPTAALADAGPPKPKRVKKKALAQINDDVQGSDPDGEYVEFKKRRSSRAKRPAAVARPGDSDEDAGLVERAKNLEAAVEDTEPAAEKAKTGKAAKKAKVDKTARALEEVVKREPESPTAGQDGDGQADDDADDEDDGKGDVWYLTTADAGKTGAPKPAKPATAITPVPAPSLFGEGAGKSGGATGANTAKMTKTAKTAKTTKTTTKNNKAAPSIFAAGTPSKAKAPPPAGRTTSSQFPELLPNASGASHPFVGMMDASLGIDTTAASNARMTAYLAADPFFDRGDTPFFGGPTAGQPDNDMMHGMVPSIYGQDWLLDPFPPQGPGPQGHRHQGHHHHQNHHQQHGVDGHNDASADAAYNTFDWDGM